MNADTAEGLRERVVSLIADWDVVLTPQRPTLGHVELADALLPLIAAEVARERAKVAEEVWDLAHGQMCRIGNQFCSAHQPPTIARTHKEKP